MQSRATLNNTSKLYWKIWQVSIFLVPCSIFFTLMISFIYPFPISNSYISFISDLDNDMIYLPIQLNLRIFHFLRIWIFFICGLSSYFHNSPNIHLSPYVQKPSYSIYHHSPPMIDLSPYHIDLCF